MVRRVLIAVVVLVVAIWLGLPRLLQGLGFHPACPAFQGDLSGKSALIISTSHSEMCGEDRGETGVAASELIHPYYEFLDAGMRVDVASIRGGEIPIEPGMLDWPLAGPYEKRFKSDAVALEKVGHSLEISEVDIEQYDVVFLAGGWGAAWDLGTSEALGRQVTDAYASGASSGSSRNSGSATS
jgi:hypothetical protein